MEYTADGRVRRAAAASAERKQSTPKKERKAGEPRPHKPKTPRHNEGFTIDHEAMVRDCLPLYAKACAIAPLMGSKNGTGMLFLDLFED